MKKMLKHKVKIRLNAFLIVLVAVTFSISGFAWAAEPPPPKLTLISNVDIFDGKTETLQKNMHVLVKGNLIETVSNEPLAVIQTDNVTMIDGGGRTLMPGMIEAHGHITFASPLVKMLIGQDANEQAIRSARRAHDYLMAGFTTVRDMGGNSFGVQKALDAGMFPGPRIYTSGPAISQTSGHGDFRTALDGHPYFDGRDKAGVSERLGWTKLADGEDEVRRAVRDNCIAGRRRSNCTSAVGSRAFPIPWRHRNIRPRKLSRA
jgi:imidazolonepropionase-like amidohydrolase